jgi:hypothetical protein
VPYRLLLSGCFFPDYSSAAYRFHFDWRVDVFLVADFFVARYVGIVEYHCVVVWYTACVPWRVVVRVASLDCPALLDFARAEILLCTHSPPWSQYDSPSSYFQ